VEELLRWRVVVVNLAGWNDPALLVQLMQILGGVYNNTKTTKNTPDMAHKHHSKEARLLTVKEQNGGRSAFEICKEMNFSPGTLKRWRDQLHLLGPPSALPLSESGTR
jgi:hypothetical protein